MAAKTDVAGRRIAKKGEAPLARYVDKDVTPRMQEFADWMREQTGYEVDPRTVYLSSVLRPVFQSSDENQKRLADRREEVAEERAVAAEKRAVRKEAIVANKARKDALRAAGKPVTMLPENAAKLAAQRAAKAERDGTVAKPVVTPGVPAAKKTPTKPTVKKTKAKAPVAKAAPARRRPIVAEGDDF